jgi:Ca2+-dependent lipid-binding protein
MNGSILTVHLIEARNLVPQDMSGTSDPYCILRIEDQEIKSKIQPNTLEPLWNEQFTL